MLFVIGVGAITDSLVWIEIPILVDSVLSHLNSHRGRRWDGLDPDVGCQMHGWKIREPARNVFFADRERSARKQDERINDGAPSDVVFVDRIVERAFANSVFGKGQRAVDGIPDRECPITNELRVPNIFCRSKPAKIASIGSAKCPDPGSATWNDSSASST